MSGDHPKKVMDGTKTMTRRVIKPQPVFKNEYELEINKEVEGNGVYSRCNANRVS